MNLIHTMEVNTERFGIEGIYEGGIWVVEITPEMCQRYNKTQWEDSAEVDIQDIIDFPLTQLPQFFGWENPRNPMAKEKPQPGWYAISALFDGIFGGDEILEAECHYSEPAAINHANRMLGDYNNDV